MYIPLGSCQPDADWPCSRFGRVLRPRTGALLIRGFDNNRVQLTKAQGDSQTAAPGSLLPIPLQVALLDASGTPV